MVAAKGLDAETFCCGIEATFWKRVMYVARERVAHHEAGHCASCLVYGLPVSLISIEPGNAHMVRGYFRGERSAATEAIVVCCLAGPCAEELFYGPPDDCFSDLVDQEMARDYLRKFYPRIQLDYRMLRMQLAAERLVASERAKIEFIAAALLKSGTLTGAAVIELLEHDRIVSARACFP